MIERRTAMAEEKDMSTACAPGGLAEHRMSRWLAVALLSLAALVFVTAELIPVGILHEIGQTFHEPVGRVGLMVTGYAWTVALSAVFVTGLLTRLERRALLLTIMTAFALGNLLVAVAPSLPLLFAGRVLGAFSHGVFWSIAGPLAVRLVSGAAKARATAVVFGGIAVATVIAVPAGTFLAQAIGWRFTFAAIALVSLAIAGLALVFFPILPSEGGNRFGMLPVLLRRPLLRRTLPATALALTGHFCAFTYVGPLLEQEVGIRHSSLGFYLIVFGLAGAVGNGVVGLVSDRFLRPATAAAMAAMALTIAACAGLASGRPLLAMGLVAIWGGGICLLTVTLQSLVLRLAPDAGDTASSMHVAMFNTGIGSGALLGGLLIDRATPAVPAWAGSAALAAAMLIVAWPVGRAALAQPPGGSATNSRNQVQKSRGSQ